PVTNGSGADPTGPPRGISRVLVLGVDHVVAAALRRGRAGARRGRLAGVALLVRHLGELLRRAGERLVGGLDLPEVVLVLGLPRADELLLDLDLLAGRQLVAGLGERLLDAVDQV